VKVGRRKGGRRNGGRKEEVKEKEIRMEWDHTDALFPYGSKAGVCTATCDLCLSRR
jgi:hypothetical protein